MMKTSIAIYGLLVMQGIVLSSCTSTPGGSITVEQAHVIANAESYKLDEKKPITQQPRQDVFRSLPPWNRDEEGRTERESIVKMKIIALRTLANDQDRVDVEDVYGDTILHKTALIGDFATLREFVEKGAKINARSKNGDTPLHRAVKGGHEDVIKFLLSVGADPNARGLDGESPLFLTESSIIMEILVNAGADPNQPDILGFYPVCRLDNPGDLLIRGANPNLVIRRDNNTILMDCLLHYWDTPETKRKVEKKFDAFLQYGADVRQKTPDGYTTLMMAAETGNVDMVKRLIRMGVNPRAKDKHGKTAADYTRRHSNHYCLLNDGHDSMAGEEQYDNDDLKKIRKILANPSSIR